jgi:DNA-binding NarL/FixJ family response regulator
MTANTREIRILLVDDHQMIREGLRRLIEDKPGLTVVGEAFSSETAMDQVRTAAPNLVLMDIHLPEESGLEITRRILAECPSVKVLALSGDSDPELVVQALRAGVSGYVIKKHGSDELLHAIQAAMDHRLYLSPELSSEVIKSFVHSSGETKAPPACVALSDRERLLLQWIAEGKRNKEIAEGLAVAVRSVETYRSRLMKKLGCASTPELVRYAVRKGIVQA